MKRSLMTQMELIIDQVIGVTGADLGDIRLNSKTPEAVAARAIIVSLARALGVRPREVMGATRCSPNLVYRAQAYCRDRIRGGDTPFCRAYKACCYPLGLTLLTALDWPQETLLLPYGRPAPRRERAVHAAIARAREYMEHIDDGRPVGHYVNPHYHILNL